MENTRNKRHIRLGYDLAKENYLYIREHSYIDIDVFIDQVAQYAKDPNDAHIYKIEPLLDEVDILHLRHYQPMLYSYIITMFYLASRDNNETVSMLHHIPDYVCHFFNICLGDFLEQDEFDSLDIYHLFEDSYKYYLDYYDDRSEYEFIQAYQEATNHFDDISQDPDIIMKLIEVNDYLEDECDYSEYCIAYFNIITVMMLKDRAPHQLRHLILRSCLYQLIEDDMETIEDFPISKFGFKKACKNNHVDIKELLFQDLFLETYQLKVNHLWEEVS